MGQLQRKSLDLPDETQAYADKGRNAFVNLGGGRVRRGVFEPGWRWSVHVGPQRGAPACTTPHLGYVLEGRMHLRLAGGEEMEVGPGDAYRVPAEPHDAWVVGETRCVTLDFAGMLPRVPPTP